MKKRFVFILIPCALVLLLLLIGVTQGQSLDPTNSTATPTNPPTSPPTDPTRMPDDPLLTEFDDLFSNRKSWYSRALLCEYDTPADINLIELFYTGFDDESDKPTAEELEYLLKNMDGYDGYYDLIRLPVSKMNEVLTQYFGITLADVKETGFGYLVYMESTDCYYMYHGDSNGIEDFKTTAVENLADGTIRMSYTTDTQGICAAVLKPVGDGYQILSNKIVGHPAVSGDILLKEYEELFADRESWHRQALICQYEDPLQINLKEFFYNGFADESRIPTDEERKALKNMPGIDLNLPLIRLPKEKMHQVLWEIFGIPLPALDISAFDDLVYLESTNCYYHTASDEHRVENFKMIKADMQLEWGRLRLYYSLGGNETYIVKIWPIATGYRILSNQKA